MSAEAEPAGEAAERATAARRAMDDRMAARAREADERRAARVEAAAESGAGGVREFEAAFAAAHAEALSTCDGLAALAAADPTQLNGCAERIDALHATIAKVATALPTAILESSTRKTEELQARLRAERERLAPKKKFSFRNRTKVGGAPGADVAAAAAAAASAPSAVTRDATTDRHTDGFSAGHTEMAGLRQQEGARLVRPAGEDASSNFCLEELRGCEVRLLSSCRALYLRKLTRCTVLAVPVAGAIYVTDCEDCTLVIACRQLRVHTSARCAVYLHAASNPIIENCDGLSFAPYPPLPGALEAAGLRADANLWDRVDDFNWIKAQQSPHWGVMPEARRRDDFDWAS
jgi:hypothetical protein